MGKFNSWGKWVKHYFLIGDSQLKIIKSSVRNYDSILYVGQAVTSKKWACLVGVYT